MTEELLNLSSLLTHARVWATKANDKELTPLNRVTIQSKYTRAATTIGILQQTMQHHQHIIDKSREKEERSS